MPSPLKLAGRRAGAVGLVLTAYDVWRMIPRQHRRRILKATSRHGTRLAVDVARRARDARKTR